MSGQKRQVLEAGGVRYDLLFSYNMLCMVESQGGTRELLGDDVKAKNFTACRAIVWAAINASKTRTVTIEEAGDICEAYMEDNGGVAGLQSKIVAMLAAAKLGGDAGGKNPTPPQEKPSGRSSRSTGTLPTG